MRKKNILVTGLPGYGKSTLVERVVGQPMVKTVGFITREIGERDGRVDFSIDTLDGRTEVLAHVNIKSPFRVGKYGVRIKVMDEVAVPPVQVATASVLIVIDEIGKMECLSSAFRKELVEVLTSPNPVLATIAMQGDSFIECLKDREDVSVFTMNGASRDTLFASSLNSIRESTSRNHDVQKERPHRCSEEHHPLQSNSAETDSAETVPSDR